jgi:hypothetical protein
VAVVLALFAALWITVGIIATTGPANLVLRVFAGIALVIGGLLALAAWGAARSVRLDANDQRLDAAIDEALAASGVAGQLCDCGHEHDPTELHVTDDPCAHDGTGVECTHSCDTCVLSSLRGAPAQSSAPRSSP